MIQHNNSFMLNMKNRDLSFLDYMDKTQIIRIFY